MKNVFLVLVSCLLVGCRITVPSDDPGAPATPQRPTFSTNTKTTAAGTLEIQGGLLLDWEDRFDTPVTVKYGATPTTEYFVDWSPYVNYDTMGVDGSSIGDTRIGVRQRLQTQVDGELSSAFQLATKLPTSDESEIGTTGEIDFFAAGIVDIDVPGISLTGFGQLGFLGEEDDEDVDLQWLFASVGEIPIEEKVSAFSEAAVFYTHERDEESLYLTFGSFYEHTPSMIFDVAAQIGIGSDTPDFAVLLGFTQNLGRISHVGR
jgi:hypothetical protein